MKITSSMEIAFRNKHNDRSLSVLAPNPYSFGRCSTLTLTAISLHKGEGGTPTKKLSTTSKNE